MSERIAVIVDNKADRDAMVVIIARNNYVVRHFKRKLSETSSKTVQGIEFWKE